MRKTVVPSTFWAKPVECLNDKEANIKGNTASWERLGDLNVRKPFVDR